MSYFATPSHEYYIDSEGGSDANDGLTPSTAWATIAHAAANALRTSGQLTRINAKARATAYVAEDVSITNDTSIATLLQGYGSVAGDGEQATVTSLTTKAFGSGHAKGRNYFQDVHFQGCTDYAINCSPYGTMLAVRCWFDDCRVVGGYSTRSFLQSVIGCKFSGATAQSINICAHYCLYDGTDSTQSYMAYRGGPLVTHCVFLVKSGLGAFGNTHALQVFFNDNTVIGIDGHGVGIKQGGYQSRIAECARNAFVSLDTGLEAQQTPDATVIGGNLYFGVTTPSAETARPALEFPDVIATEHPIPNWASGDYRVIQPDVSEWDVSHSFGASGVTGGGGGLPIGRIVSGGV